MFEDIKQHIKMESSYRQSKGISVLQSVSICMLIKSVKGVNIERVDFHCKLLAFDF